MRRVAVLNVVGLSASLLGHAPRVSAYAARTGGVTALTPVLPAVTCSVQASMLTGLPVGGADGGHGVVGNGWFNAEQQEVQFWKQSNKLVRGEMVWDVAKHRAAAFTCANLFWWFNMYSSVDVSVTPRPQYRADGRKVPDCYSHPASLRDALQRELGPFPLFRFWGPGADITSSRWIADAALWVDERQAPTLSLVYLPHLDYALQKLGPGHAAIPRHVGEIDAVVGGLIDHYEARGVRVLIVSEYGIEAVDRPVHVNRWLREKGLLAVRDEGGRELLDAGASRAFAVADHQVAHVYSDAAIDFAGLEGVAEVTRIGHERAGRYCLVAAPGAWFTYDYWLDEARAPDFARTVEIHRKPGYDPRELFVDPRFASAKLAVARRVLLRKLGMRRLMDVVPLDATLVRGSHGRVDVPTDLRPVWIGDGERGVLPCTRVFDRVLDAVFWEA